MKYILSDMTFKEKFNLDLITFFNINKVKKSDLAIFCRLFYTLINSGIKITQCLEIINENIKNPRLKESLIDINRDLYEGSNLSDSMGKFPKVFPSFCVEMIRAGEISGNLEEILQGLGDYYEDQSKMENKLKSSLIYPTLLIILSILLVIFMLSFVFPMFFNLLNNRDVSLPMSTRFLIFISNLVQNYWEIGILIFIGFLLGLNKYFKSQKGRLFLDTIKIKSPLVKTLYRNIITANFSKTLSLLLSSGIPLIKSLEIVGKVINNRLIEKRLQVEISNIEGGKSLGGAIKSLGVFPSVLYSIVSIGEESGSLDNLLLKTSKYYYDEVRTSIEQFCKLIEPILMIVVGLIVGFIVISVVLPIFDIMYII